jgi:cytidylate kinase
VAERLGLPCLDTGAMYRAAAWKARERGLADPRDVARLIAAEGVDVPPGADLRAPGIPELVRPVADSPECRAELVRLQREAGRAGGLVTEGRDQGSVVFPDADLKIYLDASLEVRARRRHADEGGDLAAIRLALERRDAADRARPAGPLRVPPGALVLDSTSMTADEVVEAVVQAAKDRPASPRALDA